MIFHLHGQPLVGGIERRPFGHSPRLEDSFHFQAKVVVQAGGAVLLHHKAVPGFLLDLRWRLRRLLETSFSLVFFQCHNAILTIPGAILRSPDKHSLESLTDLRLADVIHVQ